MNTLLDPAYLGPFNKNWGYFVYDPATSSMTAICFDGHNWDYSTWVIEESGSN